MSGNKVESSIELRIFIDFPLSIPQIDTILATIVGQYITLNIQWTEKMHTIYTGWWRKTLVKSWFWQDLVLAKPSFGKTAFEKKAGYVTSKGNCSAHLNAPEKLDYSTQGLSSYRNWL